MKKLLCAMLIVIIVLTMISGCNVRDSNDTTEAVSDIPTTSSTPVAYETVTDLVTIRVEMDKSEYSPGEKIPVKVTVENNSERYMEHYFPTSEIDNHELSFEFKSDDGKDLYYDEYQPLQEDMIGSNFIAPGESFVREYTYYASEYKELIGSDEREQLKNDGWKYNPKNGAWYNDIDAGICSGYSYIVWDWRENDQAGSFASPISKDYPIICETAGLDFINNYVTPFSRNPDEVSKIAVKFDITVK